MPTTTRKRPKKQLRIGPADAGRRMSLDDFDQSIGQDGYIYELAQGVVEVSEIPGLTHGKIVQSIRKELDRYDDEFPGVIYYMGGGQEAKLLIEAVESERHPDWTVYLRPEPPGLEQPWSVWIPEIVIEVVSANSSKRDYDEKPAEYLALGVHELWLIDPVKKVAVIKTRWRGIWKDKTLKPGQSYQTHLLPGFKLDVRKVLAAAK